MAKTSPRRAGSRVLALTLGLLTVGLLAGGCVRVHAGLTVSSSDLVAGNLLIAAFPTAEHDKGPDLTIPTGLAARVTTKPYSGGGYVGQVIRFRNLSFDEVSSLAGSISNENGTYHIAFHRTGNLVTMSGSVDLTELPPTGVDVQLKVAFPGPVTRTDGSLDDKTVNWVMKAGSVTSFTATDQYALGNSRGWKFWSLALGGGVALVSAFLVLLALLARRRNLKKERAYLAASG